MILKCHLELFSNMASEDSFSTAPPIVNGGDWGYFVLDLETIIAIVLL